MYGDHRELHGLTHSFPTRRSSDLLGGNRSDAAGDDLAALGHKALEQTDVLIVDLRRVLAGKGAGLAATEKWACHVLMPFLRCHVVAFATWADRKSTRLNSSH